jgi:NAD(P)-dependent dehydrogenase (short-subunit alcohol dehydrogenase family)
MAAREYSRRTVDRRNPVSCEALLAPRGLMKTVRDKVAVITGAASGVGLELARRLGREGTRLVLADIESQSLDAAVALLKESGVRVLAHVADVAKRAEVVALADHAFAEFGRVDMVFNNAGVTGGGAPTAWEVPVKRYHWAMDVNYFGALYGMQAFLPRMIQQGGEGLMAATASGAGIVFPPTSPAYSASKAALIAVWEVMALQLQAKHPQIKAALLFPGPHVVDTRLISAERNLQPEYSEGLARQSAPGATFKEAMTKVAGFQIEFTQPADFAEEAYQAILRDEYYILPLTEKTKAAIRKRTEDMLARRAPVAPDMF